jgi:hypothetical protein
MLIGVCDHIARLAARVQELESLEYRECRNAALDEVLVITEGMEGTEWDAAGDWLGRKIRALKERP